MERIVINEKTFNTKKSYATQDRNKIFVTHWALFSI